MHRFRRVVLSVILGAVALLCAACSAPTSSGQVAPVGQQEASAAVATAAPSATGSGIATGQAASATLTAGVPNLPTGQESWATLSLRTSDGRLVEAYAVATTKFYERGPNDSSYQAVDPKTEGFVAFSNWAGGGSCPAEFRYETYDSAGTTLNVLTRVRYFLNGE
jgi:hypothetical protein